MQETMSSRQSNSLSSQQQPYFWFSWRNKDPACSSCLLQQFVNYIHISTPKSGCVFIICWACKADWKSLENRSSHASIWIWVRTESLPDHHSWQHFGDSLLVPAGTCTCWGSCKTDNKLSSTEQLPALEKLWSWIKLGQEKVWVDSFNLHYFIHFLARDHLERESPCPPLEDQLPSRCHYSVKTLLWLDRLSAQGSS